ncbi:hypothetical protein BLA28_20600 [Eisenbergiella tayi]|uniref:Glucosidase YgjK n=1 Tax=Eisenbergiella tayi TaxID=1432052 RepID=A0A1E3AS15_9FIRM|nr:trehalase family glycosidase [Eisenbergiella tayi]ODM11281.1 Glucosidase YgjK precursor [Eisenbergiella tayi]OIZ62788.1 hypothetical protein BLA28_20600 [Eisenbergiella tayi]
MDQKSKGTGYGAYDPLYPNGIMTAGKDGDLFGIRFLAAGKEEGLILDHKDFDFRTVGIGRMEPEQLYEFSWKAFGTTVKLTWCRLGKDCLFGQVDLQDGVSVLAELYVPREWRLQKEWVNFTRQTESCFTGELISPYHENGNPAFLFMANQAPRSCAGYNDRAKQLQDFKAAWMFRNVNQHDIWNDMGLSRMMGIQFEKSFSFLIKNGRAEDFLRLPDSGQQKLLLEQGKASLFRMLQAHSESALTGNGTMKEIGQVFSAMPAYNAIYKENTGRRYIMVDRPWARKEDGWGIQFNWDTFLSSWASSWTYPELAKENMLSGYDVQLPDGKIPLYSSPGAAGRSEPPITAGRSQHIVQGITLWKTYLHTGDKEWACKCYEGAKKANAWWFADRGDGQPRRDARKWGMLGFGYDPEAEMGILGASLQPYVAKAQYAYFETYDDSPQWTSGKYFVSVAGMEDLTEEKLIDESRYVCRYHMADIYTLERCCLYAVDCESLSHMARALGREEEAAYYEKKRMDMAEQINARMWCEEDGCYYNLKFDGTFSKRQSPDCFMPLMTGCVPKERKERLLQLLKDENKFWGEYMIPSIAKDDSAFSQQHYWRGQIWPPQTLWTYLALKRAGEEELAWELAYKAAGMLSKEWNRNGYCPENYSGITGECSGAYHYNWGMLMGLPLLEELIEFREDKVIFGNAMAPDGTELKNIPVDGQLYDLVINGGMTEVYRGNILLAKEKGTVVLDR